MRRYTIILLFTVISSGALAGNPVKWLVNGADSLLRKMYYKVDYDTAYISRSPGKIGLKAWGSVSGASLRARGDNLRSRLTTDVKGTLSLEFDYYDLAVELATNPTSFKGRNHDYEINFNFYPRRFVFDINYQKAATAAGYITYGGRTVDVEKGWLDTKMLNVDAYYTFNYRHFSYDAPFYQFYQQKQSAGSWLAGLTFQGGRMKTTDEFSVKSEEYAAQHDGYTLVREARFNAHHLGIGGGYAYNLVASKRWLFHFSVVPNLIVWSDKNIEMDDRKIETHTKFPTVLMNSRAGAVYYFSPRSFVGTYGVLNSLLKRKSETELMENKWIVRVYYGMRL